MDGLIRWREGEGGEVPWLTAVWISLGCLCRYEGWYVLGGVLLLLRWDFRTGVLSARKALPTALLLAATYVGNGEPTPPCRTGSHDLRFSDGRWTYHDSYFGGSDFIGEEVVYLDETPVWAMNYYGRILREDLLTAAQAGQMIKTSLSHMYRQGRFLGCFAHAEGDLTYMDASEGNVDCFRGREFIRRNQVIAYELDYHGGLIKD